MVSVTSDVTASASYQSAAPKAADRAALPDASRLASSFASLINNNPPSTSNLLPPAPEPPPPAQPSANDNSAPSRNLPSNNNSPASSAANQNQVNNSAANNNNNNNAGNSPAGASNNNNTNSSSSQTQGSSGSSTKSDSSKTSDSSSSDKSATDNSQSADASAAATPVDTSTVAQVPIAAPLPVAIGLINSQTASPSGNSSTPLSIAAAGIATAASTTNALTAASTTDTTSSPKSADATTTTKTQGQTQAATTGTAAAPQLASAGTATSAELALATAAGTPGTTGEVKTTGSKTTTATQGKTAATTTGATTATTDPSAAVNPAAPGTTPQPTVDAKADAASNLGAAIKADGNVASAPAASSTTSHDHSAVAGNAQAPSVDANAQAFVLPQQQLSAATGVTGTDKLTATQATGGAVPLSGLAVEIAASVKSGKTSFEVRLDPADLGRIDVKIDVDRNGQVTSHLTVEKPETLSMLQQDAPQLQQALNDAGLKTGNGGLQFSLRDQSSSGQNNGNNQTGGQPQRLVISEEDSVPAAIAGRSYGRVLGVSGGVDISV